jgi:DnaK suppressor protein
MARRDALLRLNKTLAARRAELRKRLGADLAELGSQKYSAATGDLADAAFDHTGEELSSQLAELEARELNQVERALARLKQGTYGMCEVCGCKIPVERLNVLPYSTLCIKCQREAESDANWLAERRNANWEGITDGSPMEDREVRLSDLEMDYSK